MTLLIREREERVPHSFTLGQMVRESDYYVRASVCVCVLSVHIHIQHRTELPPPTTTSQERTQTAIDRESPTREERVNSPQ